MSSYATSKNNSSHVAKGEVPPPPEWSETTPTQTTIFESHPDQAFLLHDVLSNEECEYFIEETERIGYDSLNISQNYRVCTRAVLTSETIAAKIWDRIKAFIHPIVVTTEDTQRAGQGYRLEGTWVPVGLNEVWRFCKYVPGGVFAPHYDGEYVANQNLRSMKTFNLYLNGPLDGGTTNFVTDDSPLAKDEHNRFKAQDQYISYRVAPETGLALLFNHRFLHEGDYLKSGLKYLMRSDVMYKRIDPPVFDKKEILALELLKKASAFEDNREPEEAVKLYMRAYKLWPALEESKYT
eukprot:TRINITY_DN3424_c0_g1_i1.p1 TRINITY_DN3424_c0_g1~~TRINITY_DN3424_c0_g1_i1.p1  ORF type:complete len:295 (+),score=45.75 TRINITY_DN3424_c0_g1_i1:89-973(+)